MKCTMIWALPDVAVDGILLVNGEVFMLCFGGGVMMNVGAAMSAFPFVIIFPLYTHHLRVLKSGDISRNVQT